MYTVGYIYGHNVYVEGKFAYKQCKSTDCELQINETNCKTTKGPITLEYEM